MHTVLSHGALKRRHLSWSFQLLSPLEHTHWKALLGRQPARVLALDQPLVRRTIGGFAGHQERGCKVQRQSRDLPINHSTCACVGHGNTPP